MNKQDEYLLLKVIVSVSVSEYHSYIDYLCEVMKIHNKLKCKNLRKMSKRILKTIDIDEERVIDIQLINGVISEVVTWHDNKQQDYQYSIDMYQLENLLEFLVEENIIEFDTKFKVNYE